MKEVEIDAWLRGRLEEFGITRLADTTGLDYTGIPTSSCVRPGTSDSIWVYSGKGWTCEASRISCIMECLERTSFQWSHWSGDIRLASEAEFEPNTPYWSPCRFTEALCIGYSPTTRIPWVEAMCTSGTLVWVPADLVLMGYRSAQFGSRPFQVYTSNGYGAGLTLADAIEHAVFELIERHVVSQAELNCYSPLERLVRLAEQIGVCSESIVTQFRGFAKSVLSVDSTPFVKDLPISSDFLIRESPDLALHLIPNGFGLYVASAAHAERIDYDSVLAVAGYGIARSPKRALEKAVLEMCQSRATDRQGAREDCGVDEKARHRVMPTHNWLLERRSPVISLLELAAMPSGGAEKPMDTLRAGGFTEASIVAVEPWSGIHVARILVPGIETWHATGGRSRVSDRMILDA